MNQMTSDIAGESATAPAELGTAGAPRRKRLRTVLMLIVPALLLLAGGYYWLTSGDTASTDNAAVKQDIVSVSAQVAGPVSDVAVKNGERVRRGDVLFRIEAAPYRVALAEAEAQLAAARLQTSQLQTQASGTSADISGAQAQLDIDRRALARQGELLRQGFTTRVRYDEALADVRKDETALADARARAANAHAAIAPGEQPGVAAALAAVARARLNLANTEVRAPMDGVIANAERLQPGQFVAPGVGLLSLVRGKGAWVEANFKEKDLARMAPGQHADIEIDAYPDQHFAAHVESIGAGTGSEFAIIPAQNANGNWVKVTQRVPVRIVFDRPPSRAMIAGLSATVSVDLESRG